MPANHTDLEKKLWASADGLRANSMLKASEYSVPVLGLIFLRFADNKFTLVEQQFLRQAQEAGEECVADKIDYQAEGVVYLPPEARYRYLLQLPDEMDTGKTITR